jgi:hypothetical protein
LFAISASRRSFVLAAGSQANGRGDGCPIVIFRIAQGCDDADSLHSLPIWPETDAVGAAAGVCAKQTEQTNSMLNRPEKFPIIFLLFLEVINLRNAIGE